MKRRAYLAALGTAASSLVAGCGFAHYAGAQREERSIPTPDTPYLTALAGEELIVGRSGMGWFVDRWGDRSLTTATSLRGVDRQGTVTWRATLEGPSDALATDERTYVLADSRLVAVEHAGDPGSRESQQIGEAETAWTAFGVDGEWPMSANDGRVYLRREDGVVCFADAEEQWVTELSRTPQEIVGHDSGVIVVTAGDVEGLDRSGEMAWSTDAVGVATLDFDGDRVAMRDNNEVWLADTETGDEDWRKEIESGGSAPQLFGDIVVVPTGGGTVAFDRESGDRIWHVRDGHRPRPAYARVEDFLYAATGNGRVVAIEGGEVAWTSSVEDASGDPLDGWVDGDRIGFRYDSGTIRWFQREDEDIPLLI